ncbi:ricin-type beta-trefoil lectin domain protein [Lentzea sp. NEAU-D13]|uniref:Ricin-type beta-trefoil lectin domain protein n=1 Tax=Lentzea alba TaxID=2714351 RepID=A0A7C9VVS6_9PSEU|nr:RICIN domain-containing protein [Lentzea alba]NGY60301.1 ricin-type beta-trefoil lectin domain protein [Lentzea alba]
MRKPIAKAAFALTAAALGLLGTAAPALADNHFDMTVRSSASGMCLTPEGNSTADGVPIVQLPCTDNPFQRWDFIDRGNRIFQLRNAVTLKCMDAFGAATNGTPVIQWPCAGTSNQRFQASRNLPDTVILRSRVAGTSTHCLDVPGGQSTAGLAMQIWQCNNSAAQSWRVFPV